MYILMILSLNWSYRALQYIINIIQSPNSTTEHAIRISVTFLLYSDFITNRGLHGLSLKWALSENN